MPGSQNIGLNLIMRVRDFASGPLKRIGMEFTELIGAFKMMASLPLHVSKSFAPMIARIGAGTAAVAGLVAGIAALKVGMAGLSAAFRLATETAKFGTNMTAVRVISRATTEDFRRLELSAINAGIATQFSPQEAATGLLTLSQAGQNARAAMSTLIPVLDLAAGSMGQLGVKGSADAVVGTLNSFKLSADQATSVTDKLLRATQISNLQTRDFEVALSRAAATAGEYNTSLDDTLISLGLMRNANIEASVASTGFREATRRIFADEGALQNLRRIGVDSYDRRTGIERSALDIMLDVADATRSLTNEQRNKIKNDIFGARGAMALSSAINAQVEVIRDNERVMLRGREAVAHLREEMANSEGVAARFREELAKTFGGQMQLWAGTVQTLKTVIGDTFGKVLVPLLNAGRKVVNVFTNAWMAMPEPIRKFLATLFLIVSAITAFIGGATTIISLIVLLIAISWKFVAVALAIAAAITTLVAIALFPLTLSLLGIIGVVVLVKKAFDDNLGGLADVVKSWADQISLAWRSLSALLSDGVITGDLSEEFNRVENTGIRNFVNSVLTSVEKIRVGWEGISEGFGKAWKEMEPSWTAFTSAIDQLMRQVLQLFGDNSPFGGDGKTRLNDFGSKGVEIGRAIGEALTLVVDAMTWIIQATGTLVRLFRALSPILKPIGKVFVMFVEGTAKMIAIIVNGLIKIIDYAGRFISLGSRITNWVTGGLLGTPAGDQRETSDRGRKATVSRGLRREEYVRARTQSRMSEQEIKDSPGGGQGLMSRHDLERILSREKGITDVARMETNVLIDSATLGTVLQKFTLDNNIISGEVLQEGS